MAARRPGLRGRWCGENMSDERDLQELQLILEEHADCDYNTRVPSGLEALDPEGVQRVIAEATRPVVIKFGKDFCGWTKKLNRSLQVIVPLYTDRADFYEVNLPTYPHLWDEFQIDTTPMMILFQDGKEVDRSDAAEPWEVPPVFEKWFGPPARQDAAGNGSR